MKAKEYAFREVPYNGSYEMIVPKDDDERLLLVWFRRHCKDDYYLLEIRSESGEELLLNGKLDAAVGKRECMATVWKILVCFLKKNPEVTVVIESDAEDYRRFIHRGIWLSWRSIEPGIEIKGWYLDRWNTFHKDQPYTSFRVRCCQPGEPGRYPVNLSRICYKPAINRPR